ncbi:MAG: BlaI/MecI/CopY family transcriptional regulator [Acidobacteriota bacterium]
MEESRLLNDSEWRVMRALWARGRAGVAEIHADLESETGWAYSTVKTLLSRLAGKGTVEVVRGKGGREFVPRVAEHEARRSAFRALIDRAFDGTFGSFLHHLVDRKSLTRAEREELRKLLDEMDRGKGPRRK